jgi:hypothetical protein
VVQHVNVSGGQAVVAGQASARDVAEGTGFSKSKVSRMQQKARELGLMAEAGNARSRYETGLSHCPSAGEWDSATVRGCNRRPWDSDGDNGRDSGPNDCSMPVPQPSNSETVAGTAAARPRPALEADRSPPLAAALLAAAEHTARAVSAGRWMTGRGDPGLPGSRRRGTAS